MSGGRLPCDTRNDMAEVTVSDEKADRMSEGKVWDVGAAGAVVQDDRVLMVRATYGGARGRWLLPGGYANHDERLDQAAEREVREETGVEAKVTDIIGLRTRYTEQGGAVFVLFRMRPVAGDPAPDGVEVDRVAYFSAAEVQAMADDEIMALARNAALAALSETEGLPEDEHFPLAGDAYRAFLVRS
jgi:ADP-ribose pyrophosphatase YjhB (NUDIX family)